MLEQFIMALIINSSECKIGEVEMRTPYGYVCLTKEQADRFRGVRVYAKG